MYLSCDTFFWFISVDGIPNVFKATFDDLAMHKLNFQVWIKMDYTFMGNKVVFILASLLNRGQLLKERICSHRSKLFSSRVDPISEGLGRP